MDHFIPQGDIRHITKHAIARCNQRGIRTAVIELVLANFDRDHHAGAGTTAVSLSKQRTEELRLSGVPAAVIDQVGHTVLILGDDGAIITVINRPTWFARFHYGAERLGHRRRSRRRCRHSRTPR